MNSVLAHVSFFRTFLLLIYVIVHLINFMMYMVLFFSLVFIKRGPVVEADKSFSSQLQIMNLGDGSPYETLHSYVSNAVSPYFKSYIRETGKAER